MPNSVERALADSLSLEHPDVPWQMPAALPLLADLKAGIATLEAQAAPVQQKHAAWCLAKLVMAFEPNTKLTAEETRLRLAVWIEANADLGDALWSEATLAAIQSSKWMPKPGEFRAFVAAKLSERTKRMTRCRAMLAAHGHGTAPAEKPLATPAERIRDSIAAFTRHGMHDRAANAQRKLDHLEGRVPVDTNQAGLIYAGEERPPFVPSTSPTAQRTAQLAAQWRGEKPVDAATLAPPSAPGSDGWDNHEVV